MIGDKPAAGILPKTKSLPQVMYSYLLLSTVFDAVGESKFMLPVERSAIWALLSVGLHAASQGHVIGLWQLP